MGDITLRAMEVAVLVLGSLQLPPSPEDAGGPARPEPTRAEELVGAGGGEVAELERYLGTFRYVGSDAERAAIEAAVDHGTHGMPGQPIARGELLRRSAVRPSYTFRLDRRGTFAVESPGYPPEVFPLDGSEVPLRNKYGDQLRARLRVVEGALVQDSRTGDGGGTTRFELQPDGKTLVVTRISWSPKLPAIVNFRLTYLRAGGT